MDLAKKSMTTYGQYMPYALQTNLVTGKYMP